jgi:hypothetical protein
MATINPTPSGLGLHGIHFERGLQGYGEVRKRLLSGIKKVPLQVARNAKREFEKEKIESQKRTPVDTGDLLRSHYVNEPEIESNGTIRVEIGAGTDLHYALRVHEDLDMAHPNGGQAKFLESTLNESAPYMAQRIAAGLDLRRTIDG